MYKVVSLLSRLVKRMRWLSSSNEQRPSNFLSLCSRRDTHAHCKELTFLCLFLSWFHVSVAFANQNSFCSVFGGNVTCFIWNAQASPALPAPLTVAILIGSSVLLLSIGTYLVHWPRLTSVIYTHQLQLHISLFAKILF